MSLISWNYRGLENPRTVWDLCQLVKDKQPRLLFLMKTKIREQRMQSIRNMLGFEGMFVVNPLCLSGGLALFWKETKDVTIQNYSLRHINGVISLGDNSSGWKFTGFYGHLERSLREDSWMLLAHLKHFSPQPWLCVGDFNEIVNQSEKVGGASRSEHQMELFHSTLDGCNLCDLGYQGSKFTWNNYRDAAHFTKECLDRATATTK
jgi:hypothetical protein